MDDDHRQIKANFRYTKCSPLHFVLKDIQEALGCARWRIWKWFRSGEFRKAYPGISREIEKALPDRAWNFPRDKEGAHVEP